MDLQTIGEIILAILTALVGGGGVSSHIKHKNRSKGLKEEVSELDKKIAVLENSNKYFASDVKEIKSDLKYIRKKLEGGK